MIINLIFLTITHIFKRRKRQMDKIAGSIAGAIIMIVIMAVPILAIIFNAQLRKKQLDLERVRLNGISASDLQTIIDSVKILKEENDSLRKSHNDLESRIHQLEEKV